MMFLLVRSTENLLTARKDNGLARTSFTAKHLEQLYSAGSRDPDEIEMIKQASYSMYAGMSFS